MTAFIVVIQVPKAHMASHPILWDLQIHGQFYPLCTQLGRFVYIPLPALGLLLSKRKVCRMHLCLVV